MNFMMSGPPVVAYVDPRSDVARIVQASGGGWVVDNRDPARFAFACGRSADRTAKSSARGGRGTRVRAPELQRASVRGKFGSVLRGVAPTG
jgi:hypothetical protein